MSAIEQVIPYAGRCVTLPVHNTPYNLYTLLRAILPNCPPTCRELNIQFSAAQNGGDTEGLLLIGDSQLDAAAPIYGIELTPGQSNHYGAGASGVREVYLNSIYLCSTDMDDCQVNVEVQN